MLADFQARLRVEEEARKRALRRTYAGIAVGAVHVVFVVVLLASEWIPVPVQKIALQPLTWLNLQQPAQAIRTYPERPRKPEQNGYFNPAIIPKFTPPKQEEEENNAINLGYALGRSLACGANSYEWLNAKMRSECRHKPWQFVYDRYGNIVLDAAPRLPQQEEFRPSDIQAHERNTAPLCPQNVDPNAPCLSAIIGGHR